MAIFAILMPSQLSSHKAGRWLSPLASRPAASLQASFLLRFSIIDIFDNIFITFSLRHMHLLLLPDIITYYGC